MGLVGSRQGTVNRTLRQVNHLHNVQLIVFDPTLRGGKMVDFEGGKQSGFEALNDASDKEFDSNSFQDASASYSPGTRNLPLNVDGIAVIPAGTSITEMEVQGDDLVITLSDGTELVIEGGAVANEDGIYVVPPILVNGVAVTDDTIETLLGVEQIIVRAGPGQISSSGGNFADDEGSIQDAFDLGNLLPYTEFGLAPEPEEEIIPDIVDEEPDVVIETPDNPVGVENAIATKPMRRRRAGPLFSRLPMVCLRLS